MDVEESDLQGLEDGLCVRGRQLAQQGDAVLDHGGAHLVRGRGRVRVRVRVGIRVRARPSRCAPG